MSSIEFATLSAVRFRATNFRMKRLVPILSFGLAAWALTTAQAGDWPNWRGPDFNGATRSGPLPAQVSKDAATWSSALPGKAGSTPVIAGKRVFVTSPDEARNLMLLCLDAETGKTLWSQKVAEGDKEVGKNNMAAPSPVTDGKSVFVMFGTGDLAAFDVSGTQRWHRSVAKEFGSLGNMWIYGASPVLVDGTLFVQVLQRDELPGDYPLFDGNPRRESFLLALDPASGKTRWKHVRKTDSTKESHESYATPFPYRSKAGTELVVVGGDHVSGHKLEDGAELWRARLYEKRDDWYRIVTSPVAADGLIYASGPKGQPVVAFREGGRGDVTGSHRAWEFRTAPTDWATPAVADGHLFVLDGGKRVLSKLNAKTGEAAWSGRLEIPDTVWSSPTVADGKVYLLSESGTVVICDAGAEFKVLSKTALGEGPAKSSVAVADDALFVRTASRLYRFGVR